MGEEVKRLECNICGDVWADGIVLTSHTDLALVCLACLDRIKNILIIER